MPLDTKSLTAEVSSTFNRALMPILERVATVETRLSQLDGVRDRLVTVETKCCDIGPRVDSPAEQRLMAALDRLSSLEYAIQRAESHEATIQELRARLAAAEATASQYAEIATTARQLIERVAVIEAKSAAPSIAQPLLDGLTSRVQTLEHRVIEDPAMKECASIRERIAVVESRASVPGPAGPAGAAGKDGADGLGFDDLVAEQVDERSFVIKAMRGDRAKSIGTLTFPVQVYRGVWAEGHEYTKGDGVTWGGSEWHCNEATTSKPGESKAWTLKVKKGRDGRDGKDAPGALPVVTVGGARA